MSAYDDAAAILRRHTGCLGVLSDSAVDHVMYDLGPLLATGVDGDVLEAADWMVGNGDEDLGAPFHEGAYRSLIVAVRNRRQEAAS